MLKNFVLAIKQTFQRLSKKSKIIVIAISGFILICCCPVAVVAAFPNSFPTSTPTPSIKSLMPTVNIESATVTVTVTQLLPTSTQFPPTATRTKKPTRTNTMEPAGTVSARDLSETNVAARITLEASTDVPVFPTPLTKSGVQPNIGQICERYCDPTKSKPCGDACISLSKTCHMGPGTACSK